MLSAITLLIQSERYINNKHCNAQLRCLEGFVDVSGKLKDEL